MKKPRIPEVHDFAKALALLDHQIASMPTRVLRTMLKKLPRYTATNCWWAEFHSIPIVTKMVEEQLAHRSAPHYRRAMRKIARNKRLLTP